MCALRSVCSSSGGAGAAAGASGAECSHAMECQAVGWPVAKLNLWRLEGEQQSAEIQLPFPQSLSERERDMMSSPSCPRRDAIRIDSGEPGPGCAS